MAEHNFRVASSSDMTERKAGKLPEPDTMVLWDIIVSVPRDTS